MPPAILLSCLFLALVAIGHVLRLVLRLPFVVGTVEVPMWPSVLAVLVTGGLSIWLWREGRPRTS